jgi:DNA ligase-1
MSLLLDLVETSRRVAATTARRAKIRELASYLRSLGPDEMENAVNYLSGEISQGKIGVAHRALQSASATEGAREATLSISDVDQSLSAIDAIRGTGSARLREQAIRTLFARATPDEKDFLLRLIVGELRQGALAGVMVDAIGDAAGMPVAEVRRAAMYAKRLGAVARVALLHGIQALRQFQLQLFVPALPMLAQTAADAGEALRELGGAVEFEWKLDGARIQAHKASDEVRIYTRGLNEVTDAVPEIAEALRTLSVRSVILDGEAIAFDANGRPHSFQTTMRRFGRKLEVETSRIELPIRAFYFDCLYVDGQSIADRPARERIETMEKIVPATMRVPRLVTSNDSEARDFYDAAIKAGHEGLMAKSLDSNYEAGNRGASWLKIKRAHTLDLVVLAAEWGHGRRAGKLSNLHLGALEPATGEFVMLGKTFKGLTDDVLEWQTKELLARETHHDQWTVYVRPELVVEIAFSDLQVSIRYPGGLALRLARVKRYRDDKLPQDADTMEAVRRIHAAQ